ncbi:MOSC domain-containing protein [Streptomyces erythrochromogenes]|uniref:MOSC domain-containing protein n=1 Tax=Streptomyces erythrochromogenes TaxID=285574 RepID=UPI0037D5185E
MHYRRSGGGQRGVMERLCRYPIKSTGGERLRSRFLRGQGGPGAEGLSELIAPDGRVVDAPTAFLRAHLGREDVEPAREGEVSHFDQLPISVLTTATLDWVRREVPDVPVDERRFRPNLLVRTPPGTPPFVEDEWMGRAARLGTTVRIDFLRSSERCVMTGQAQQGLRRTSAVLKAIATAHDNRLDALATVLTPGTVRVGDPLVLG